MKTESHSVANQNSFLEICAFVHCQHVRELHAKGIMEHTYCLSLMCTLAAEDGKRFSIQKSHEKSFAKSWQN